MATPGDIRNDAHKNVQSQLKSIEALIHKIEKADDPALAATARELVQLLMDFHGAGIERMLELVHKSGAANGSLIDDLGRDELVRSLLLLYGLHPDGIGTRVMQGLEKARPYLKSHGGNVVLVGIDDAGTVTLRLEGNCDGCPSSSATLRLAVEEAIYEAAPDVTAIVIDGAVQGVESAAAPGIAFVPLAQLSGYAIKPLTDRSRA